MRLSYNQFKFDLKFFWRSVYGPQRWSQHVKNDQSFHNPSAVDEGREGRREVTPLQLDVAIRKRKKDGEKRCLELRRQKQPAQWLERFASQTAGTQHHCIYYLDTRQARYKYVTFSHTSPLWPGLSSLQLEHNINRNGEKKEFLWLFNV